MTNEQPSINEEKEKKFGGIAQPISIVWVSFGIASIVLVLIGLFRFSDKTDSIYFIYICLIAFAVAAFPWVSSIRVKGIIEIDRTIENVRQEARDRVEQAGKRFDDRLFVFQTQLSSIQTQVSQQTMTEIAPTLNITNTTRDAVELSDDLQKQIPKQIDINEKKVDLPTSSELPEKYSSLRIGFAKATAIALNDPLGTQCGKILHQVPETGQSFKEFEEVRLNSEVSNEQFRTMMTLGLISIKKDISGETDGAIIDVSELGRIYEDYWNKLLLIDWSKIDWSKIGSTVVSALPSIMKMIKYWSKTPSKPTEIPKP